jgi:hypothetical protein
VRVDNKEALASALAVPPPVVRSSSRFLLPRGVAPLAFGCRLYHPR